MPSSSHIILILWLIVMSFLNVMISFSAVRKVDQLAFTTDRLQVKAKVYNEKNCSWRSSWQILKELEDLDEFSYFNLFFPFMFKDWYLLFFYPIVEWEKICWYEIRWVKTNYDFATWLILSSFLNLRYRLIDVALLSFILTFMWLVYLYLKYLHWVTYKEE